MDTALDDLYDSDDMLAQLEKMGSPEQVRLNTESLYKFLMCQPDPEAWLSQAVESYAAEGADPSQAPWFCKAKELLAHRLQFALSLAEDARAFARASREWDCNAMEGLIASDAQSISLYMEEKASDISFDRWSSPKKRGEVCSDDYYKLQELRNGYKEVIQSTLKRDVTQEPWEMEKYRRMEPPLRALCAAVRAFMKEYQAAKHDAGVMDYNDLEQMALKLTLDEGICEDLRRKYRYIFVDEYQDSSAVQETILNRISRGNNVFHVGDVKQSIYGFRQSDPDLFLREQEKYKKNDGGQLIALNRNFRSLPNVLHCVNRVFSRCMNTFTCDMEYDALARLYPGRTSDVPDPATIVQIIEKESADHPDEDGEYVHSEVEAVARLVKSFLGTPIHDKDGSTRPARYGDIVILRRAVQSALPQYMEHFQSQGIPVFAGRGGNFYETVEIRQALDYLWAVHNPLEDVHLLGALRGVGEMDAQQLAQIRIFGRGEEGQGEKKRMYTCLISYANAGADASLRDKCARFLDRLRRMRDLARESTLQLLCETVLEDTGLLVKFASLPKGRVRAANLRSLPVRAAEYDASGLRLGDFLRRIESTAARNREEDVPAFSENDDAVRIMTVHQSKGLEFPIVIGAGLGASFRVGNDKDAEGYAVSRVWCDKDCGIALEYYDDEQSASDDTLKTRALAMMKEHASIAEEMRILYVLMTRARERLALVGEVKSLSARLDSWLSGRVEAHNMLDWIAPAVLSHEDSKNAVRFINEEWDRYETDDSHWDLRLSMEKAEIAQVQPEEAAKALPAKPQRDEKLIAQLTYQYPHPEPTVQQKASVSELAHGAEESFFERKTPAFLSKDKKLKGAARGSALHRFMQILDYEPLRNAQDAQAQLLQQVKNAHHRAMLTAEEAEAVAGSLNEITRFLDSSIGKSILSGAKALREKPFELRMDEQGQMRLVQGVIDLMVLEDDGCILVDYKTDHVGLDAESVRQKHGAQVSLYRKAAELAGLTVKKCVVYLFYTGAEVEV